MTISAEETSVVVRGDFSHVDVDVNVNTGTTGDATVFHLTHGVNLRDPAKSAAAFRIDGGVRLRMAPGDSLAKWEIGFTQFVRFNFLGLFYAGRRNTEGSIAATAHSALPSRVMLDPNPTIPLFMSETRFTLKGDLATNAMGDHPYLQVAQKAPNFNRGVENFLFHIVDNRDFWSVFSIKDDTGKFQHLAHIYWNVHYNVQFKWVGGVPMPSKKSTFSSDGVQQSGPPKEPDLASLLSTPAAPFARDELLKALRAAMSKPPNPHRSDNPSWFRNVPPNFFT
jgi:hypothetical protein